MPNDLEIQQQSYFFSSIKVETCFLYDSFAYLFLYNKQSQESLFIIELCFMNIYQWTFTFLRFSVLKKSAK